MLVDARTLPPDSVLRADVCIVGAGPAGITLARALRRRSVRVCVVESGAAELDEATETLATIPPDGGDLSFPPGTRRRRLGGTSAVWDVAIPGDRKGVRLRPLDAIDFAPRDWVPHSGWPITAAELVPYYARAQREFRVRVASDDPAGWPDAGADPWPLDAATVRTTIDQFTHRSVLIEEHARELAEADDVQVLLWANVTALEPSAGGDAIDCAQIACLDGARHRVHATTFVLACGGIENARLLLLSGDRTCGGIGNAHDVVGRYFMDHMWQPLGVLPLADPAWFARSALYDIRRAGDTIISGRLQLTDDAMREERLLNAAAAATPRPPPAQEETVEALRYLRSWGRHGRAGGYRQAFASALRSAPYAGAITAELAWRQRRFPPTITSGWSGLRRGGSRFPALDLELQLELPPDPDNRVVLTDRYDALGMPVAAVRYRLGELEALTLERNRDLMGRALADAGVGRLSPPEHAGITPRPKSIHHHIGTTRMHESRRLGVVDCDSRVHGTSNLYVTGSSVFPTGGYANPTLTIVALALRLGDHLAGRTN